MQEWKFREMQKSEVAIDPVQTQFFTTNIVGGLSSALVRESIQNSIDARLRRPDKPMLPVFVEYRIFEIDVDDFVRGLFNGLTEHLNARKSGISTDNIPDFTTKLKVLVIEDYNTIGLPGSITENKDPDDADCDYHNFYWFWRRVGKSGKRNAEIGRWGLGKTVFPASSMINTFFGITVREDDGKKLIMGSSILKTHHLDGEDKRISPYGFFGIYNDAEDQFFVQPVSQGDNQEFFEEFEQKFHIQRKDEGNENLVGFSVIIPCIWDEINSGDITKSIIEQFYYPVLKGNLIIKIEDKIHNINLDIDKERLEQITDQTSFEEIEGLSSKGEELKKLLDLSKWAINLNEDDFISLMEPNINSDPIWRMEWYLNEDLRNIIKLRASTFFSGERIAFRVPVKVHKIDQGPSFSYFRVFFEYDRNSTSGENYFIRDGITISAVRPLIKKGLRVLIIIEKNDLAALLGDSENPAHTEWQRDAKSLKERYVAPEKTIGFVIKSLSALYSLIIQPKTGLDYEALQDVFFIDNDELQNEPNPEPGNDDNDHSSGTDIGSDIIRNPSRYKLSKIHGGFKLAHNENFICPGIRFKIHLAYMISHGNPLKKYNKFDFDLSSDRLQIESTGISFEMKNENMLEIYSESGIFNLKILGFDVARDLFIKIQ